MSHGHFITICSTCGGIISQCRCMSNDKIKKYAVCNQCQQKEVDELIKQHGGCHECG